MSMVACEKCGGTLDCICGSVAKPEFDCHFSDIRKEIEAERDGYRRGTHSRTALELFLARIVAKYGKKGA